LRGLRRGGNRWRDRSASRSGLRGARYQGGRRRRHNQHRKYREGLRTLEGTVFDRLGDNAALQRLGLEARVQTEVGAEIGNLHPGETVGRSECRDRDRAEEDDNAG
jgi:hypothetical protein